MHRVNVHLISVPFYESRDQCVALVERLGSLCLVASYKRRRSIAKYIDRRVSLLKCRPVVLGESTESSSEMLMTDMRSIDRERAVK